MELKDHLTTGIDTFTAFYLEQVKSSTNINESLNYVNEAQRRISKEANNEKILRDTGSKEQRR